VAGGAILAALSVLAWCAAGALVLSLRRGAAGRAVEEGLPDALEAMARSMRSGASTHQALLEVAVATPGLLGDELRATTRDLAAGVGLEPALGALARRRREPGVRLAVAALQLGADAGGAHARALDGVAASVRARLGVVREVRAMSSQARMSALVIGVAPLAFAVLAAGMDGEGARFLLRTPLGLACLTVGVVLDGLGALWMHRLAQVEG
jgi:tight adherence protein B